MVREPLLHFVLLGGLLYGAFALRAQPKPDERQIIVDRAHLIEFIQYRSRAFEPSAAAALLDAMNERDAQALASDYIEEEVLHKEALKLGIGANDYVIRQRLVQSFRYLAEAALVIGAPEERNIEEFYTANQETWRQRPSISFSHIFFDADLHADEAANLKAKQALAELKHADARAVSDFGDRFLYHQNYVERTDRYVALQFGDEAAANIFAIEKFNQWLGPITSSHGEHLIYVSDKQVGGIPPLAQIRSRVQADWLTEQRRSAMAEVIAARIAEYDVVFETH